MANDILKNFEELFVGTVTVDVRYVEGLAMGTGAGRDWCLLTSEEMPPLKDWVWLLSDVGDLNYTALARDVSAAGCANVAVVLGEHDALGQEVVGFACTSTETNHWGLAHAYIVAGFLPPVALVEDLREDKAPYDEALRRHIIAAGYRSVETLRWRLDATTATLDKLRGRS